jgi:hypothetical protein
MKLKLRAMEILADSRIVQCKAAHLLGTKCLIIRRNVPLFIVTSPRRRHKSLRVVAAKAAILKYKEVVLCREYCSFNSSSQSG